LTPHSFPGALSKARTRQKKGVAATTRACLFVLDIRLFFRLSSQHFFRESRLPGCYGRGFFHQVSIILTALLKLGGDGGPDLRVLWIVAVAKLAGGLTVLLKRFELFVEGFPLLAANIQRNHR
jgi:hypothetical protein